jgi:transposase-like protein
MPSEEEITALLAKHGGDVGAIAKEIERPASTIRRWLADYGLKAKDFK